MNVYSFVLHDDIDGYSRLLKRTDGYTAYHTPQYLLAEEAAEEAPVNIFVYDDGERLALLPSIKRNIGAVAGLEKYDGCYDLKTPHEYSSVLASDNSEQLCAKFFDGLAAHCRDNNVVFQFIRFNPYRQADLHAAERCGYHVTLSNRQTTVPLEQPAEKIFENFSSSARRNVRTAMRNNLTCDCVEHSCANVETFRRLYVASMKRLDAKPFFYFNAEYFAKLLNGNDDVKLVFVKHAEDVVAASILLLGGEYAYYHLGCFDVAFSHCRPMDYLLHRLIQIGKAHGKKFLHLGGGSPTLKDFKQRFSNARVDYYVAHKIFDEALYDEICSAYLKSVENVDKNFLPLYRGGR